MMELTIIFIREWRFVPGGETFHGIVFFCKATHLDVYLFPYLSNNAGILYFSLNDAKQVMGF